MTGMFATTYNLLRVSYGTMKENKEKKDKDHEHFANDDPTKFNEKSAEEIAKEAIKKFKSLNS